MQEANGQLRLGVNHGAVCLGRTKYRLPQTVILGLVEVFYIGLEISGVRMYYLFDMETT